MKKCIRCGHNIDTGGSYAVRLNNCGLPNQNSDEWGDVHKGCATVDELSELDGSKYFGKNWKKPTNDSAG